MLSHIGVKCNSVMSHVIHECQEKREAETDRIRGEIVLSFLKVATFCFVLFVYSLSQRHEAVTWNGFPQITRSSQCGRTSWPLLLHILVQLILSHLSLIQIK